MECPVWPPQRSSILVSRPGHMTPLENPNAFTQELRGRPPDDGVRSSRQRNCQPNLDAVHGDEGAKPLDVVVSEEQAARECLVGSHRRHHDHQNEVSLSRDVVALLDLRNRSEFPLGGIDQISRPLITSTSTKIVMGCPTWAGSMTATLA